MRIHLVRNSTSAKFQKSPNIHLVRPIIHLVRIFALSTSLGWFKNPISSQTEKLMAATKFSDYLGLNHYKKAKKLKHFIHLRLANRPQSFGS